MGLVRLILESWADHPLVTCLPTALLNFKLNLCGILINTQVAC